MCVCVFVCVCDIEGRADCQKVSPTMSASRELADTERLQRGLQKVGNIVREAATSSW